MSRNVLEALKDALDKARISYDEALDLLKKLEPRNTEGFASVARSIRDGNIGRYNIGDTITTEHKNFGTIVWRIIGINADGDDSLTVMASKVLTWMLFDMPTKQHRLGHNRWAASKIREWLHGEFKDGFDEDDLSAIRTVKKVTRENNDDGGRMIDTYDDFFLLSASEAGFDVDNRFVYREGDPYEFFEDCEDEHRKLMDMDCDEAVWWLRSPHPAGASYVRSVYPDGALTYYFANHGRGAAPACVIGKS